MELRPEDFDYDLPEALIALRPARPRPASRLLVARPERIADSTVARLGDWLERGDLLVFNDTKVIPAQLIGMRRRGDNAAALCAPSSRSTPKGRAVPARAEIP